MSANASRNSRSVVSRLSLRRRSKVHGLNRESARVPIAQPGEMLTCYRKRPNVRAPTSTEGEEVRGDETMTRRSGGTFGALLDVLAALLCIGGGLYLLQTNSVGSSSWFQVIAHGMGVYFIGKGLFVGRSAYLATIQAGRLAQLVELAEHERGIEDELAEPVLAD